VIFRIRCAGKCFCDDITEDFSAFRYDIVIKQKEVSSMMIKLDQKLQSHMQENGHRDLILDTYLCGG